MTPPSVEMCRITFPPSLSVAIFSFWALPAAVATNGINKCVAGFPPFDETEEKREPPENDAAAVQHPAPGAANGISLTAEDDTLCL